MIRAGRNGSTVCPVFLIHCESGFISAKENGLIGVSGHTACPDQNGTPVVLLHGGGIDSARLSWGVLAPLSKNFRCMRRISPWRSLKNASIGRKENSRTNSCGLLHRFSIKRNNIYNRVIQ
jgi:pimeloyl-ACP methyl ester carboxylesterase